MSASSEMRSSSRSTHATLWASFGSAMPTSEPPSKTSVESPIISTAGTVSGMCTIIEPERRFSRRYKSTLGSGVLRKEPSVVALRFMPSLFT